MSTQFRILPLVHHHHLRGTADEVLAAGAKVAAEPAGAAFLEGFEKVFGLAFQAETGARLQVVEGKGVGIVVGIVAMQGGLNLFGDRVGEGDAACVSGNQRPDLLGKPRGMGDKQSGIFRLPLVAVRGHPLPPAEDSP